MNITWLGQSGYLLEMGGQRVVIDPFFSDIVERKQGLKRLMPPPCSIKSLAPDVLFITHYHLDHFDPETVSQILNAFPSCRLLGPDSVIELATKAGFHDNRLTRMKPGETFHVGKLSLTATPARHSDPLAVGLLIQADGELLWFSGDTLYFPELSRRVRQLAECSPDVAFICINGKLGNMDLHEAARVVSELQPRLAVPMHYGMFTENTANPDQFINACAQYGQVAIALKCGQRVKGDVLLSSKKTFVSRV
jgi:L-ascorbate 6-phosphate lactonase